MKAKQSILASVALAAIAVAAFGKHRQNVSRDEQKYDEKCHQEALDALEAEGGLVLA